MGKHTAALIFLCVLCFVAVGVFWQNTSSLAKGISSATTDAVKLFMHDQIEEKARKAKGNDESSVRELADAIFSQVGAALPADVREKIQARLVRAEMKYRNGKKGVRETHIVRTINELADKFGAPDYAKTSPLQVRIMRVKLMKTYPSFIAIEIGDRHRGLKKKVGEALNPELSPLEAAYLAMLMIQQKMLSEDWQQTPEEYAANLHKKHAADISRSEATEHRLVVNPPNIDKRRVMWRIVTQGIARQSPNEMTNLVDESLDNLGIER